MNGDTDTLGRDASIHPYGLEEISRQIDVVQTIKTFEHKAEFLGRLEN